MSENINREIYTELANRIYDLDAEVYRVLGSSLGRTFTGNRDTTIRTLSMLMYTKPDGHLLRSELALISNMARTIKDPAEKSRLMTEYDEILKAIEQLPNMFGSTDILDAERAALNLAARREKISENDHLLSVSAVHREVPEMILVLNLLINCELTIMMWKSLTRL